MMDANELIQFIVGTATQKELKLILAAIQLRNKTDREIKALENQHSIYAGDVVRLHGLRPEYLNGMEARVTGIKDDCFEVFLFGEPRSGTSKERIIPFNCVTKLY